MDYSKLNAEELTVAQQMLAYMDEPLRSSEAFRPEIYIPTFAAMMQEYVSADNDGRDEMWGELGKAVYFQAYAESMGVPEIASALQKVASDMVKMDSKSLQSIASGGLAKLTESTSAQK